MDRTAAAAGHPIVRSSAAFLGAMPLLVGRAWEQATLREELASAVGGHGRLVLLGGEAGIGKTTLARDLIQHAAAQGCVTLTGSCFDLSNTPPYGPWLELFEASRRDPDLPAPPVAFAGGQLATVTDQAALFAEIRQFLAELTRTQPALILLEDLHWADPASIDLLRHIGPHVRHWPGLLLVTYRADELSRDHPLSRQLPALVREAEGMRLDLRRLDRDALRALVSGRYRLERPHEDRLVTYLERHAEGNPFFATELLRTLEEKALLRCDEDRWSLGELDRVFVPALLRQVIDGRVERLGEAMRGPLAMAAVIGQEVPLALWAEVAALDEETLLDVGEQAVEAHLLVAEYDGTRVHFVHALTREALYEGILPPRRRTWHRRIAEALVASPSPDPDTVAYHLQQAGDPRAWEWLFEASVRAQRAYAWLTAADRLSAAAALLEDVEGDVGTRGHILYRLAHLKRFSDAIGAIADCANAERLAVLAGIAVLAAESHYARGLFLCYSDRLREGLSTMLEGIEAIEAVPLDVPRVPDPIWGWWIHAFAGSVSPPTIDDELATARLRDAGLDIRRCVPVWFLGLAGQPREAVAAGERFLSILALGPGATEPSRYAAAFAEHGLGIAYAAQGRPDDACQAWARSRAVFHDPGHHVLVAFSLCNELWDRIYPYDAADPALRRRYAAEAEAALGRARGALAPGLSPRIAWLSCFVLDGRWEEALRILQDLPPPGNTCLRREITGPHATIARHRGDAETAWRLIHSLHPAGPDSPPGDIIHQEGLLLQRLAADICVDDGDLESARAWLTAHDAWLTWSNSVLGQAEGRLSWARWQQAAGDAALARSLATEALTLASTPDRPLVHLAAHRLLGEIETTAGDFASAERQLAASLELATVCELPFERALTLLALAEMHMGMGDAAHAADLLATVREICLPLGAVRALARADILAASIDCRQQRASYPGGLTQREVDVLRLLAQRKTDKEIAEALFLGPRTIQSHVAHILNKLGVANRREAAAEAARLALL
jgi:DNA-binding CsgD family transcriptional regulator